VPTFGFGGSSQSESFNAYIGMPVTRNRVYVQQSVTWYRSDPFVTTSPALDSLWLHSTVGYAMSRWLRLEGFYSFARQNSSIPGGLIHRQRIGAQVVLAQPMRIR
jgi:predicted DCC family thiol-disulfide oxidoreductase YuxK